MKKNILFRAAFILSLLIPFLSNGQSTASNSLLWRVSGNGLTASSYLYGTMHSRDKRVFHFADSVMNCFERCPGFVMELVVNNDTRQSIMDGILLDSSQTLKGLMQPQQYDSVSQYCQQHIGMGLELFNNVKPIYVMFLLMQSEEGNDGAGDKEQEFFLDEYLQHLAQGQLKSICALEQPADQLKVFDILSYKEQVTYLLKSIREPETDDSTELEKMVLHYTKNELEELMAMENDFKLPEKLFNQLFTYRNIHMANKVDSLSHSQATFFAFGAAHLVGEGGVVSLLRKKGFVVEPVFPTFNSYLANGWYRFSEYNRGYSATFPELPTQSKTKMNLGIVDCDEATSTNNHYRLYSYPVKNGSTLSISDFYKLEYPLQANLKLLKTKTKKEAGLMLRAAETIVDCKGEKEKTFITFQNATRRFVLVIYSNSILDEEEKNKFLNSIKLNPS